jgi:hypothetical protein
LLHVLHQSVKCLKLLDLCMDGGLNLIIIHHLYAQYLFRIKSVIVQIIKLLLGINNFDQSPSICNASPSSSFPM